MSKAKQGLLATGAGRRNGPPVLDLCQARSFQRCCGSNEERAREASLRGDWNRVEQIIMEGRKIAQDNEWLQNSLSELQVYATRRQRDEFSKEAFYSSDKMNRRLSSHSEMSSNSYDVSDEYDKKAYLRRKIARGKRRSR